MTGAPTPEGLAQTLAAVMPEHAIIADESVSHGRGFQHTHAAPHTTGCITVGGGAGLPMATGAAIAATVAPPRRIHKPTAPRCTRCGHCGRRRANVCGHHHPAQQPQNSILIGEYKAVGAAPGPTAMSMFDFTTLSSTGSSSRAALWAWRPRAPPPSKPAPT